MNLEYAAILLNEVIISTSKKEPNLPKLIEVRDIIGAIYND